MNSTHIPFKLLTILSRVQKSGTSYFIIGGRDLNRQFNTKDKCIHLSSAILTNWCTSAEMLNFPRIMISHARRIKWLRNEDESENNTEDDDDDDDSNYHDERQTIIKWKVHNLCECKVIWQWAHIYCWFYASRVKIKLQPANTPHTIEMRNNWYISFWMRDSVCIHGNCIKLSTFLSGRESRKEWKNARTHTRSTLLVVILSRDFFFHRLFFFC